MEDGLFYSESALLNRVLFYADYNDINIFVRMSIRNTFMKIFFRECLIIKLILIKFFQ